tara:strand:- start:2409 stop:3041 length:633 start_codon:yes stop_codon:yes gene_type:complete
VINIVLVGAGGHAKVVQDLVEQENEHRIVGCLDSDQKKWGSTLCGMPILGGDSDCKAIIKEHEVEGFIVTVGNVQIRKKLFKSMFELGLKPVTVVHPQAYVASTATIGAGTVVLAQSVVQVESVVGENCIINHAASIDHECAVGDHSHIAPGVNIAGAVNIGESVFIGIGSSVIQCVSIGAFSNIGAGSVVVGNIPGNCLAYGCPALIKI